jgi:hypothetical protein
MRTESRPKIDFKNTKNGDAGEGKFLIWVEDGFRPLPPRTLTWTIRTNKKDLAISQIFFVCIQPRLNLN